jgi:hypothetical protein
MTLFTWPANYGTEEKYFDLFSSIPETFKMNNEE